MLIIRKYASLAFRMSTTFPVTLLNRVALHVTEGVKVASEGSFSVFFFSWRSYQEGKHVVIGTA